MFNKENCFSEMQSSINAFSVELKNIRTGRVSPDILKTIVVDSYGSKTPLTQLSNINNLDNMTLNVNIWDTSLVKAIEKSILAINFSMLKFWEYSCKVSGLNFRHNFLSSNQLIVSKISFAVCFLKSKPFLTFLLFFS